MADGTNDVVTVSNTSLLGDALTPAELAFRDSKGENADALVAEYGGEKSDAKPDPKADAKSDDKGKPKAGEKVDAKAKVDPKADVKAADADDDDGLDESGVVTDPTKQQKTVSFHKFERIRKKLAADAETANARAAENERKFTELSEKFARGDERLRLLTEALTPKQQANADAEGADDPEPDPDKDIIAHVKWQRRHIGRLEDQLKGARDDAGKTREAITQRDAANDLKTNFQRDAVAFAQKTPDFIAAYNHLMGARANTLELQGYSQDDIRKQLAADERAIVARAFELKKSPAEVIYGMAQGFGYQKPAPKVDGETEEAKAAAAAASEKPNGKTNGKPSATEIIETIKNGQAAGKTLSGSGGSASELSVEALVNMSEPEFAALLKSKPAQVHALMGKR